MGTPVPGANFASAGVYGSGIIGVKGNMGNPNAFDFSSALADIFL